MPMIQKSMNIFIVVQKYGFAMTSTLHTHFLSAQKRGGREFGFYLSGVGLPRRAIVISWLCCAMQ